MGVPACVCVCACMHGVFVHACMVSVCVCMCVWHVCVHVRAYVDYEKYLFLKL